MLQLTTIARLGAMQAPVRVEYERCAKSLADTAAAVLVSPTAGNLEALHEALQVFTRARKALDG